MNSKAKIAKIAAAMKQKDMTRLTMFQYCDR